MLWTDKAKKILKKYWGIDNLKDKQFEVINNILLGNDVIGLLPTGYGKSMCYLIPPLVSKKTIFIISPLISLMEDQKEKLNNMNIPCSALHSNNINREEETFRIMDGDIKIVYMSPEYLLNSGGMQLTENVIESNILGFLAIDEAHCISGWGHDFRPEYSKIKIIREMFPTIPIMAVTATATDAVCRDIIKVLKLNNPEIIRASFDRPNLYIKSTDVPMLSSKTIKGKVVNKSIPKENIIMEYIKKYPNQKIIVYINSRDDTEDIALKLNKINKDCCDAYHAGMKKELRLKIQNNFSSNKTKIIISTIAFGMGIDQIVKCIIIFGSPSSIEEFYQQIGRGGRDGKDCETILYFDYSKYIISKYMLNKVDRKSSIYQTKLKNLSKVLNFVYSNTCRRKFILEYFNEECDFFTCNNCDNCCENEMIDMTDILWDDIMKPNLNIISIINNLRNKYFNQIQKNNKAIDIDLMDPIWNWLTYIKKNKISKDKIPNKLKLNFPKKFIKIDEINSFESKISYYEKFL